ncbi:MAG: chorismate mutase [Candidatus Gastranaerophilales bacterium]|nr:chorismate mutase [Candidatus Gastranaerophilales bacterium]
MYTRGIRGAITLFENTKEEIESAVVELTQKIIDENSIQKEDITFIIFTVTSDINADFPAKYARLHLGFDTVPMMCYREMEVTGALSLCLRALVAVNTEKSQKEIKHCYLRNAKILRKDL